MVRQTAYFVELTVVVRPGLQAGQAAIPPKLFVAVFIIVSVDE